MSFKTENSGLLIGITTASIALLVSGVIIDNQLISIIGGSSIGASISVWIAKNDIIRIESRVISTLEETLTNRVTSNENKISHFRHKWNIFFLTEMDGKKIWIHEILDFSEKTSIGALKTSVTTKDKQGDDVIYLTEGMLRDNRLLLFEKAEHGDEPVAIFIFPLFSKNFHTTHYGVSTLRTWDGNNAITPAIISKNILFDINGTGQVDEIKFQKLDSLWKREFYRLHNVLSTST